MENHPNHHLNRSLSPYGGNNFHHLHPFPAKSPPAQSPPQLQQPQQPPPPSPHYSHSQLQSIELPQLHSASSMRRGGERGYFGDDLSNETEYSNSGDLSSVENSLPLNRHHRNASNHPALIATTFPNPMSVTSFTTPTSSPLVFLSPPPPSSSPPHHNNNNIYSSSAALAALAPAVTTSTLPSLLVWSSNNRQQSAGAALANRTSSAAVDWTRVRQSLNGTVGQLLTGGRSHHSSSSSSSSYYSTASPHQLTTTEDSNSLDVFDGSENVIDAAAGSLWPTAQDIPILIGAIAGGAVLLIVVILLLVIWNCCDRDDGSSRRRDKSNFNNGSSDRSNRSSLSAGSCGSNSNSIGTGVNGVGGVYGKRHSSNLYINNPNSLEVEHSQCSESSPDSNGGGGGIGSSSTTAAAIHHQLKHHQQHYPQQHYHFTNYDYGPGPASGGQQQPGVAQLVIGNARVLAGTTVTTPPEGGNAIPRSVSVPLSRSNSTRKDSNTETGQQSQQQPVRSQLSQALTRNIGAYYETQRKKNGKQKGGGTADGSSHPNVDHHHQSSSATSGKVAQQSSAIILNDLSLNLDMLDDGCSLDYAGNVIVNHNGQMGRPNISGGGGQWVMLQTGATTITANAAQGEVDLEAYREGQADFYRTRSLPWSQSSRGGKVAVSVGGAADQQATAGLSGMPITSVAASSSGAGSSTTMGRVNFTKKRRNRMRNDSAAAIAINRSGFLGGSLDWDFQGVGRGSGPEELPASASAAAAAKPVSRSGSNAASAAAVVPSTLLPCAQPSPVAIASTSAASPAAVSSAGAGDTGSPDSAEFLPPDAIVVYNERTAL